MMLAFLISALVAPSSASVPTFSLAHYKSEAASFGDPKVPRLKRVDQFEALIREVVEKSNEVSTHLSPDEIDRVLPLFELKTILVEVPLDRIREHQCNGALNQILATAGPSVRGPRDLSPIGSFVYETIEKVCN